MKICGKIPHSTPDKARKHMVSTIRRNGKRLQPGKKLNIYKCQVCDAWHFGRIGQNDRRAK